MPQAQNQDQTADQATPVQDGVATITLDTPIKRGTTEITEIKLRKPDTGALRGISLTEVLQMNVTTIQTLLPRISEPTLAKHEIAQLDAPDLLNIGIEITGFFASKADKSQSLNA